MVEPAPLILLAPVAAIGPPGIIALGRRDELAAEIDPAVGVNRADQLTQLTTIQKGDERVRELVVADIAR